MCSFLCWRSCDRPRIGADFEYSTLERGCHFTLRQTRFPIPLRFCWLFRVVTTSPRGRQNPCSRQPVPSWWSFATSRADGRCHRHPRSADRARRRSPLFPGAEQAGFKYTGRPPLSGGKLLLGLVKLVKPAPGMPPPRPLPPTVEPGRRHPQPLRRLPPRQPGSPRHRRTHPAGRTLPPGLHPSARQAGRSSTATVRTCRRRPVSGLNMPIAGCIAPRAD